jgi:epoxyqueuosine reductase
MDIKAIINKYSKDNGIAVGFTDLSHDNLRGKSRKLLKTAESVIVIGVGYNKKIGFEPDGIPRGRLAMYATGVDYHIRLRDILAGLRDFLAENLNDDFDSYIHVDSGPWALPERYLALRCGLARLAKNRCVYNYQFGTFFNIGCMLTSLDLSPYVQYDNDGNAPKVSCDNCSRCVLSCPSKALTEVGYDYQKCISYINQKKGKLSLWESAAIGDNLFGCDICQEVCPLNKDKYVGEITDINEIYPSLDEILSMDERGYGERFGQSAIFWRGLDVLRRNAEAVLFNYYEKGDNK